MAIDVSERAGHIWIVDDSPPELDRARKVLEERYVVECFFEGERLLDRVSQGAHPDLLLLDWGLPGVSGLEVCRYLRARYDAVTCPILVQTARGAREDFTRAFEAGANDHLAHPYDDAELLARVATLVRIRQQAEMLRARENRLATTLSSIGEAVVAIDLLGKINFVNPVAEMLTGWSEREVQGRSIAEALRIVDEQTAEPVDSTLERVLQGKVGAGRGDRALLLRKDGTRIAIDQSVAPIRGPRGELVGAVLVLRDVSKRKSADEILARHARHSRLIADVGQALTRIPQLSEMLERCATALVEHVDAAFARIWLLDEHTKILRLQASAGLDAQLDGWHAQVPVGKYKIGLIAQRKQPFLTNAVSGDAHGGDEEWALREGMVAFAGYPLLVGQKLVGVVALFSRTALQEDTLDVLQQVADTIALGVERLRAESALRTRADFEKRLIGIVSHDLRNPLNAILLGATTLLTHETLTDRSHRTASRIRASAERASRMICDLLDFTQARLGGGLSLRRGTIDLHALVRQIGEEVEVLYPGRDVRLRLEGSGVGQWDSGRIGQVIQNLLTNALSYSSEDTPVVVEMQDEGDWGVSLSVYNEGDAIPSDMLSKIFEPLQRATGVVNLKGRSIGLGLYIVKHIVEAHGGSVEVSSSAGQGTTFTVRLPRDGAGAMPQPRSAPPVLEPQGRA